MRNIFIIFLSLMYLSGCASMKESLIAGASMGAVSGGLIGNADAAGGRRDKNTKNAAVIGALLGAGIGYLAFKEKQSKKHLSQQKVVGGKEKTPLLTIPKIKRVWIEDRVRGKRFIKGHWEYIIKENSVWSQK